MSQPGPPQMKLNLTLSPVYREEDFLVAGCNSKAFRWLERWPEWPACGLILSGPPGCGKTHLAEIWRGKARAKLLDGRNLSSNRDGLQDPGESVVIEDADKSNGRALLSIYNGVAERKKSILLTATTEPQFWSIPLADLRSRLMALPTVKINQPDDLLLQALLVKQFSDRQVKIEVSVIRYLVERMERSFYMVRRLADELDAMAFREKRKITTVLASRALRKIVNTRQ
tara:strand:+ start:641 stop:1324 length:684 start_codon:yes stop_codon:yes gene_type:complete